MRWILTAVHAFLCVGAVGAGQAFVREPSGGTLGLRTEWLEGSPFPDYGFPGLFLAVVIGGANGLSTLLLVLRHPLAPAVSFATGILLVSWVAVQTVILGFRHWSQGIWWVLFTLVAVLGGSLFRRRDRVNS